jgi:tetratricopeptide (TPR) repeat protein
MIRKSAINRCPHALWRSLFALVILGFTLPLKLEAQSSMAGHDMGQMKEVPSPESLPAPEKVTGIGNSHLKITATPEAQAWFDQGLNMQHDFWNYEATRAFMQAVRVDPKCAMCYWGLAESLGFYHGMEGGFAQPYLDKAVTLKDHASKKERLYIEATVAERKDSPTAKEEPGVESKATGIWREAVKKDSKDMQARIFLAESLMDGYDDAGEPKAGTAKGIAVLEEVLKISPDDSAANHYWIHAMEPSAHPERARQSAKKLAGLAPASGHMVHMPGHIFYRTGDYAEAERWFAQSTTVDESYMRTQHVGIDDDWNYVHNLMYGIDNLMQEGKLQQAAQLSGKLAGARGQFADTLYTFSTRDSMTRVNTLLPIALRTGDWHAVVKLLVDSKPDAKLENLQFLSGELKGFAGGMIAVESGDLTTAQNASNALDAALWRKSQAAKDAKPKDEAKKPGTGSDPKAPIRVASMPDAVAEPLLASLSVMSLELRASIFASQKKLPEAKELFKQAMREEMQLGYHEPPNYIRPVEETEGLALLRAGDALGAHDSYAAALKQRPNSGFALYGMARSSEAQHKTDVARDEYVRFLDAWREGDSGNPELAHAHEYLAGQVVVAKLTH